MCRAETRPMHVIVIRRKKGMLWTEFHAEGGTRTRTPRGATPSRWCVCQFHHFGEVERGLKPATTGLFLFRRRWSWRCALLLLLSSRCRLGGRRLLARGRRLPCWRLAGRLLLLLILLFGAF